MKKLLLTTLACTFAMSYTYSEPQRLNDELRKLIQETEVQRQLAATIAQQRQAEIRAQRRAQDRTERARRRERRRVAFVAAGVRRPIVGIPRPNPAAFAEIAQNRQISNETQAPGAPRRRRHRPFFGPHLPGRRLFV